MAIASIGIDLGKTTFHLVALGERGWPWAGVLFQLGVKCSREPDPTPVNRAAPNPIGSRFCFWTNTECRHENAERVVEKRKGEIVRDAPCAD